MKTLYIFWQGTCTGLAWAVILCAGLMMASAAYGQFTPVNFDGAPVLKPGQMETSLYLGESFFLFKGETDSKVILPGIKIGFGIAKNFDMKLSYGRSWLKYKSYSDQGWSKWYDLKENEITLSPKISFLKGLLAMKVPVSFLLRYSDYDEKMHASYSIGPRVILSLHYKQYIEFNISPFFEFFIPGEEGDVMYLTGGNLGFAFSSNLQRWSIRPEAFVSYPIPTETISEDQLIYGWGVSASFSFDAFGKH